MTTIAGDMEDARLSRARSSGFDVVCQFIAFTPEQMALDIAAFSGKTGQSSSFPRPRSTKAAAALRDHRKDARYQSLLGLQPEQDRLRGLLKALERAALDHRAAEPHRALDAPDDVQRRRRVAPDARGKAGALRGDGTTVWTLTRCADFAVPFVKLFGVPQALAEDFHITSDHAYTWDGIYATIAAGLGVEADIVHVPTETLFRYHPAWEGPLVGDKTWSALFDNSKVKGSRATSLVRRIWRVCSPSLLRAFRRVFPQKKAQARRVCSASRSDRTGTASAGRGRRRPRQIARRFPRRRGCDSSRGHALEELMRAASARAIASQRNASTGEGLERAVGWSRQWSAEFPFCLANHLPMVLVALHRMGASDERLEAYCEIYRQQNGLVPVPERIDEITAHNWREFLGAREREADYRAFFDGEVARLGATPAAILYLPQLMPGMAASATHALMRMAYATMTDSDEETGVALGYWAATYLPLGPSRGLTPSTDDPAAVLAFMYGPATFRHVEPERDLLWHFMRAVAEKPEFAPVVDMLAIGPETHDRVARFACALRRDARLLRAACGDRNPLAEADRAAHA